MRGLEGVRRVRSSAAEGMGGVSGELDRGVDMSKHLDDIKNEIDRIDTFPAETEQPVIKELTRRNQVIDLVLYGDVDEKALKTVAEQVRDDLRNSGGISQVELAGVRADEISIEVAEQALRRFPGGGFHRLNFVPAGPQPVPPAYSRRRRGLVTAWRGVSSSTTRHAASSS